VSKDLAVIVVHGMGDTARSFDQPLRKRLRERLGTTLWSRVAWERAYYQPVLQANQERLMKDTVRQANVDWRKLRRFILFGFSDAAAMGSRPHQKNSVYQQVQQVILDATRSALTALGDPGKPVVLIAHSLGCQVVSNFIWDAQQRSVEAGVFRNDLQSPIGKTSAEDRFCRLKTLRALFTSGCNIPVFIAGLPKNKIKPVITGARGWQIRWENYYDPDDALGWPLHPLNPAYKAAVAVDKAISAGTLLDSWSPLSHNAYWSDDDFLGPVEESLRALLRP
jgi:hypothetical protein